MRAPVGLSVALAACCLAAVAAQTPQAPVFRSGVEVLEVDVSVVDGQGKPVRDLQAGEFTVSVDGQARRVVSSEYISDVTAESQLAGITVDPYVSNNTDRRPGRLIVLVIDQNNMTMDRLRGALDSTKKFIASLAPNDRVALMAIPSPGPVVEFTTNHQQVQDALNGVVGHGDETQFGRFNISDYEALAFTDGHDQFAVQQLLIRLCGVNPSPRNPCRNDVEQDASQRAQQIRSRTQESVSALGGVFRGLKDVDGPKSLILLSQGMMLEEASGDAGMLAELAAEARVSLNVLLYDWNGATNASERRPSNTQSQDHGMREEGLSTVAGRARGALFRVTTNPQYPFERISLELAGHYILGVEPSSSDRDGKQHHIKVQVGRKGTSIRARQQFQYVPRTAKNWSRDELMSRVLSSPSSATEIPMRVTTYAYRDDAPQSQKVKVVVAAEFDPSGTGALDLAVGHAVYDEQGHAVDVGQERKIYSANSDRPLRFDMAVVLEPGTYRFRLAAVDTAGNSGSVERELQAWRVAGQEVAVGDLMLASQRDSQGGSIRPPVLLKVDDGHVQTFTEVYTNKPGTLATTQVAFEVAEGPETPALKSDPASVRRAPDGLSVSAASNVSVTALPPGRYMMRAVITSSGRVVGNSVRPFVVLPSSAAVPKPASTAAPAASAGTIAVPSAAASLVGGRPLPFKRDDVLQPDTLRATFDALEKNHPLAKGALSKARTGQLEGTAMMALDAGDQTTGAILRGLEFLTKGQIDPAATQFGVALRSAPDLSLASFYLGACYAAAGRDREALTNWERARAANLPIPALPVLIGDAYLRVGQPAQAVAPLSEALGAQPQNDSVRKALAVVQATLGQHAQAYATIEPYLDRNPSDADALMVALQAIYQAHAAGKTIGSPEQDNAKAVQYAKAYAAAKGPSQALVEKWLQFLTTASAK
jgi:VWFA-related protein